MNSEFSNYVCNELGLYVYRLIDPRDGQTFYVGKGKDNRVFEHVKCALNGEGDKNLDKVSRIIDIKNAGLDVLHVIHRHKIKDEKTAYEIEAALIDAYPGLTNAVGGHNSHDFGPRSPIEIKKLYGLEVFPDDLKGNKIIFIKINKVENYHTKDLILQQTQTAWRIDKNKASSADLIISVLQGVSIGVFENSEWIPATISNFKYLNESEENRSGFHGKHVSNEIWNYFVGSHGKRIDQNKISFGSGQPIKYSWR